LNILCVRCGKSFSITAEQLGTRGKCPHCQHTILLPRSERAYRFAHERRRPPNWGLRSASGVTSIAVHIVLISLLLWIPWRHAAPEDALEESVSVNIASTHRDSLTRNALQWDWSAIERDPLNRVYLQKDLLRPATSMGDAWSAQLATRFESAAGSLGEGTDFDSFSATGDSTDDTDFGGLIERLQRDGLDIVITFDSTGSMDAEIRQVKARIERIGGALFKLIPQTRISICTYRDEGDAYVVQGLRLSENLAKISEYLDGISAEGGGDAPEAVDQGLRWAIEQNEFRPSARKVVLLFGDAPPHPGQKKTCLNLAASFRQQQNGSVSTVTCHSDRPLVDFVEIAVAGGGESFLSRHAREIMSQLMVLVFGSEHREKVIEALDLLR
jgi:DNA-directed RNA polymerase subunit RPC12/RpoP